MFGLKRKYEYTSTGVTLTAEFWLGANDGDVAAPAPGAR